MADIPEDVMKLASETYDASLVSIVNKDAADDVLAAIARAILAERERCAKIVESDEKGWPDANQRIAALIRDGKEAPCCAGGPQWGHAWDCPKCPD